MADTLNSYQYAGLLGTTMSGVMSGMNTISQAGFGQAQSTIQAGGMEASGIMQAGDILIQSDWNTFARENQQLDMMYQAKSLGIDQDILSAQSEMVSAQSKAKTAKMTAELNDMQATLAVRGAANRGGGVAMENIARQAQFKIEQGIALNETEKTIMQSQIAMQKSKAGLQATQSELSAKSASISSVMEAAMAKSRAGYVQASSASAAASMRKQAKLAGQAATISGLTQMGFSLFSGAKGMGYIK